MRRLRFDSILRSIGLPADVKDDLNGDKFLDLLETTSLARGPKLALAYLGFEGSYYDGYDAHSELLIEQTFYPKLRHHLRQLVGTETELVNVEDYKNENLILLNFLDIHFNSQKSMRLSVRPVPYSTNSSFKHNAYRSFRQNIWVPLANRFDLIFWTLKSFDRLKLVLLARRDLRSFALARVRSVDSERKVPFLFKREAIFSADRNYRKDTAISIIRLATRYCWDLILEIADPELSMDRSLELVPMLKFCKVVRARNNNVAETLEKWRSFLQLDFKIEIQS
ncbi:MAG: hypothetical protein EOP06_02895 [Proteobacteria bacterium]|nr:MAG: hypothetical protein EOP06_02895 [Pseudomonadota bacterium]